MEDNMATPQGDAAIPQPGSFTDANWPAKIELARLARQAGEAARANQPTKRAHVYALGHGR